jgi:phospholipase D1/2
VWAVLKPGCLSFYASRLDKVPLEAIMFQPSTVVADQLSNTGSQNGALIVDSAWMCELKFDNTINQKTWVSAIEGAVLQCPYVERSRFSYESTDTTSLIKSEMGSHSCQAQWFVNGKEYFEHLYTALNEAKWQVLLSGWFLSADIYLKRPIKGNEDR